MAVAAPTAPVTAAPAGQARRLLLALLACLPLALLVGLRGDTRDTQNYIDAYAATTSFPWNPLDYYQSVSMEWGFGIAAWLFNALSLGPRALLFAISLGTFALLIQAAHNLHLKFAEVAPYYLGTFFLLQQFMQIRQGIAMPLAVVAMTMLSRPKPAYRRMPVMLVAALMLHITAAFSIASAVLTRLAMPRPTRRRIVLWLSLLILVMVILARAFMSLEVIAALGRLSVYAVDEEYSASRELWGPANIRAVALLILFVAAASPRLLRSRPYALMLGLYGAHVGIRLGFYDFAILSGRLSTSLSFVEIFMLPLLVRDRIRSVPGRQAIAWGYFLLHAIATLGTQVPYLIDDYLTPLHIHYTAH